MNFALLESPEEIFGFLVTYEVYRGVPQGSAEEFLIEDLDPAGCIDKISLFKTEFSVDVQFMIFNFLIEKLSRLRELE